MMHNGDRPTPLQPVSECGLQLCVLSSSSGGNSCALLVGEGAARRLYLIDLGLSPRRTRAYLADVGLADVPIAGALLTHLDTDHWKPTWVNALPKEAVVFVHRRHRGRAGREGVMFARTDFFDGDFDLPSDERTHVHVRIATNPHDDLGSVAFRFMSECAGGDIGFATDIGEATRPLINVLRGVDVLAVESNYCPEMQEASSRPLQLKERIMGGSGHLSNEQSAQLVREIAPKSHVVLLHLSRECNHPNVAKRHHQHECIQVTVARPDGPIPWVAVRAGHGIATPRQVPRATLFG